jgi:hypothetical protein
MKLDTSDRARSVVNMDDVFRSADITIARLERITFAVVSALHLE